LTGEVRAEAVVGEFAQAMSVVVRRSTQVTAQHDEAALRLDFT